MPVATPAQGSPRFTPIRIGDFTPSARCDRLEAQRPGAIRLLAANRWRNGLVALNTKAEVLRSLPRRPVASGGSPGQQDRDGRVF